MTPGILCVLDSIYRLVVSGAFMDIRECIRMAGDIIHVREAVSTEETLVSNITGAGSRPVLFENYHGSKLLANIYSDRAFVSQCLGCEPAELLGHLGRATANTSSPVLVETAPFMENEIVDVDLSDLPVPLFYSCSGGPYLTSSIFSAGGKDTNISYHRVMITGKNRATVRVCKRDLFGLYEKAMDQGRSLPVAICLGVSPEVALSAAISLGPEVNEFHIADSLMRASGGRLELFELDNGCLVPASSEYVLQGRLTPELETEGPFVDITGTLDGTRLQPVLVVDRVYHRNKPLFHAILPGGLEHYLLMGLPREVGIYEALVKNNIDVGNVYLTRGGCSWLHGVVSLASHKSGDAVNAGRLALDAHTSMKQVVVVDDDIDIFDPRMVEWALATRFQGDRDLIVLPERSGSSLDPSSTNGLTCKMIFDATKPSDQNQYYRIQTGVQ